MLKKRIIQTFVSIVLILIIIACASPGRRERGYTIASWYGPGFHGKYTASGEKYNMYAMTCAHKELPLGTRLKVTNVENAKSAVVVVNDRGPFVAGREIDLSLAAAKEIEIDLVVATVAELGFENGAKRSEIYTRAKELGLELCPPEVGPQLRLQYRDQPMNERLLIGMELIADSDGNFRMFNVEHDDGGRWLDGRHGHPDHFWRGDDRWVFLPAASPSKIGR